MCTIIMFETTLASNPLKKRPKDWIVNQSLPKMLQFAQFDTNIFVDDLHGIIRLLEAELHPLAKF